MTTYYSSDWSSDISDLDSTTGTVNWQVCGGCEGAGSLYAMGTASYGRENINAGNTLYVLARLNIPLAQSAVVLRGRDSGDSNTCWEVLTTWSGRNITLKLRAYDNSGSNLYTLTHPVTCHGICWIKVKIVCSATAGTVQAWINGEEALAETAIPTNSNRVSYYLDMGVPSAATSMCANIDYVRAADEDIDLPALSLTEEKTWTQNGRTYKVYSIDSEPTGGKEDLLPNVSNYVIETLKIIRGCISGVELFDANGNTVFQAAREGVGEVTGLDLTSARKKATQIRVSSGQETVRIYCCVRTAA